MTKSATTIMQRQPIRRENNFKSSIKSRIDMKSSEYGFSDVDWILSDDKRYADEIKIGPVR